MIYSIQGGDHEKREEIIKALGQKLSIGEFRIVRDSDIDKVDSTLPAVLAVARFLNNKTGDTILSTQFGFVTDDPKIKQISLINSNRLSTNKTHLDLNLSELTVDECVNQII